MLICSYCGCKNEESASNCNYCGAPLSGAAFDTASAAADTGMADGASESGGYEVWLAGRGSCQRTVLNDLLEDLMGYSDAEAEQLINNIPVRIGYAMTADQARTLAQGLSEYGAQVTVYDPYGNADQTAASSASIFNSDGSLVKKALLVLATLSAANRVRKYNSFRKPGLLESIFLTGFGRQAPPRHVRRKIYHPQPRPVYPEKKPGLLQTLFGIRTQQPQAPAPQRPRPRQEVRRDSLSRREPAPSVFGPGNFNIGSGRRNGSPDSRGPGGTDPGSGRRNGSPDSRGPARHSQPRQSRQSGHGRPSGRR